MNTKKMSKEKAQELFDSIVTNPTFSDDYKNRCLSYCLKRLDDTKVNSEHLLKLIKESNHSKAIEIYNLAEAANNFIKVLHKHGQGPAAKAFINKLSK